MQLRLLVLLVALVSCGEGPLWKAIRENNVPQMRSALDDGADPDQAEQDGTSPLMIAAARGDVKMVELLLRHHAKVNARDRNGDTALHLIASRAPEDAVAGDPDPSHVVVIIGLLLTGGADLEARNAAGETPLARAARWGASTGVGALLAQGANVRAVDTDGATPLHLAATGFAPSGRNAALVIALLVSYGADINARAPSAGFGDAPTPEVTPLFVAVDSDNIEAVEALLLGGADPNPVIHDTLSLPPTTRTPLSSTRDPALIAVLRAHGATGRSGEELAKAAIERAQYEQNHYQPSQSTADSRDDRRTDAPARDRPAAAPSIDYGQHARDMQSKAQQYHQCGKPSC